MADPAVVLAGRGMNAFAVPGNRFADAASGAILGSRPLPVPPETKAYIIVGGMAWVDTGTVRVACAVPPGEGVHNSATSSRPWTCRYD